LGYGVIIGNRLAGETGSAAARRARTAQRAEGLAGPFEARVFVNNNGDSLLYRILKPVNYDPDKKYPLVVCLHGGNGSGTDNLRQIDGSAAAQYLSNDDNRRGYPAFLFVPQCPPGFHFGGVPDYPSIDLLIFETIHQLEKEFSIDTLRRYVLGESMGGIGTWHLIAMRPEMFAAAIPVCGIGNPQFGKKMVDVNVWAFHGRKDRNIPVRGSSDMIAAIKKAGGNPRYTEYPEEGHIIAYLVYDTEGLWDWLFVQKRK
jgi:predicted peptidase